MANLFNFIGGIPDNVYRNHFISNKLLRQSVSQVIFAQFAESVPGVGKHIGDTINIPRISAIPESGSSIMEDSAKIRTREFKYTNVSAVVKQYGEAVKYESWAEDLTKFNLNSQIQKELVRLGTLILDTEAANALVSGRLKYAATGATTFTLATNGIFGATANANLSYFHVEQIRDALKGTYKAPYRTEKGGGYILIGNTKAVRGLRSDADHKVWHQYTDPKNKWNGEEFKIENVRILEDNHESVLKNVGIGGGTGEAIVFGDEALNLATIIDPHIRTDIPAHFGLKKATAWYGAFVFFQPWNTGNVGEAKSIHFGSA